MQEDQKQLNEISDYTKQKSLSEEQPGLLLEYIKEFVKNDIKRIIFYCLKWKRING